MEVTHLLIPAAQLLTLDTDDAFERELEQDPEQNKTSSHTREQNMTSLKGGGNTPGIVAEKETLPPAPTPRSPPCAREHPLR